MADFDLPSPIPAHSLTKEEAARLRNKELRLQRIRAFASGGNQSASSLASSTDSSTGNALSSSSNNDDMVSFSSDWKNTNTGGRSFPSVLPNIEPLKALGTRTAHINKVANDASSGKPSLPSHKVEEQKPKKRSKSNKHTSISPQSDDDVDATASKISNSISLKKAKKKSKAKELVYQNDLFGQDLQVDSLMRAAAARTRVMSMETDMATAAASARLWGRLHFSAAILFAIFMFYRLHDVTSNIYVFGSAYLARLLDPDPEVYADLGLPPMHSVFLYFLFLQSLLVTLRIFISPKRGSVLPFNDQMGMADPMMEMLVSRLGSSAHKVLGIIEIVVDVASQVFYDLLHVIFVFGICLLGCWFFSAPFK